MSPNYADAHADALSKAANFELEAIADRDEVLLTEMTHRLRPARAYRDGGNLLNDSRVELVVIAVHDRFHVPLARKALVAGKHIQSVLSCPERRESAIACLRCLSFAKGLDDLHHDRARVRCPALILAAEGDPVHPFGCARRIAQCLPDCALLEIVPKSAIHEARHLEEVDRNISNFLRSKLPFLAVTGALASKEHIELGEKV